MKKANQCYTLLDSGNQCRLESFGEYTLIRPCSQALWQPILPRDRWNEADAVFTRVDGNTWETKKSLPRDWVVELEGIKFKIGLTDFGHVGVFPEHSLLWKGMKALLHEKARVLNLFAYSGGATLAAAQAGAHVCHLDASKGMVQWARENAILNGLQQAPIRWIVDDVIKFLNREVKRESRYEGIVIDPPSFGRGNRGEVFKIERDLATILTLSRKVLSESPLFVIFTTHTPGMTPIVMHHLMEQMMGDRGKIEVGEMVIPSEKGRAVPCGSYARWSDAR
jgi:23S rRNA (cytosine1962-C5)-methyltransferase